MRGAASVISICALTLGAPCFAAPSGVSVEPEALAHYSYCVNEAKDRSFVYVLSRQILYRCHGDVAISYFNYLGHRHAKAKGAAEEASQNIDEEVVDIDAPPPREDVGPARRESSAARRQRLRAAPFVD